ncbi:hypothetical protein HBNXNv_0451 [Candidatus Nanohalovita haloferacivicina]|nr:hypothetical protein HBNXNv_0451 [Candidatus Nanohalobia archaeon BNXNv]
MKEQYNLLENADSRGASTPDQDRGKGLQENLLQLLPEKVLA